MAVLTRFVEEKEDVKDAVQQIEAGGAKVHTVEVDLMEDSDCKKVVDEHIKTFGGLDILVNNASKQMSVDPITPPFDCTNPAIQHG